MTINYIKDFFVNPTNHKYFLRKQEIPGVTKIIGFIQPYNHTDVVAMAKGTNIHAALELWDKGNLDEKGTPKEYQPFIEGWEYFKKVKNLRDIPTLIEVPWVDLQFMYAGCPDRIFINREAKLIIIVDIKTGTEDSKRDQVQLYGYAKLIFPISKLSKLIDFIREKGLIKKYWINGNEKVKPMLEDADAQVYRIKLYNCYLDGEGSYKSRERKYTSTSVRIFLSYLNIFNYLGGLNEFKRTFNPGT